MAEVYRIDRAPLPKATRLDNGMLRVDAPITRVGVFVYRRPDGTERRELRLPEEVFHQDALASMQSLPVTDRHPPELVTAENAKKYAVGYTGTDVRADGDYVRSSVTVMDAAAVGAVEDGARRDLSLGYKVRLDESPGEHPRYGRYDAIQRRVRGNHLAIVERGRAGPDVSIRCDASDAEMVLDEDDSGAPAGVPHPSTLPSVGEPADPQMRLDMADQTTTLRLDGVDYTVPTQAKQAFEAALQKREDEKSEIQKRVDALEAERDTEKARADAAEKERDEQKARADAAEDPKARQDAIKSRLELERKATAVLGDEKAKELKLDEADDAAIKRAVVESALPGMRLDEASDAYLSAAFDAAVTKRDADAKQPHPSLGAARARADAAAGAKDDDRLDAESMIDRQREAARKRFKDPYASTS